MNKVSKNISYSLTWILEHDYKLWSLCLRKKKFLSKSYANKYIIARKFGKPMNVFKCRICGFYHVGTDFKHGGTKIATFGNKTYKLVKTVDSQDKAIDYVKYYQRTNIKFKIRTYNKPISQRGMYYIYADVQ